MRAFTKKEKLIKFSGCYHGHADAFLVAAGSGVATLNLPDSPGVLQASVGEPHLLTVPCQVHFAVCRVLDRVKISCRGGFGRIWSGTACTPGWHCREWAPTPAGLLLLSV